jgi:beta-phosphoglucomutase-like phosphatase (HAD superfamily)
MLSVLQGIPVDVNAVAAHRDDAYLERVGEVGEVALVTTVLRREHGNRGTALATGGGARTVLATVDSLGLRGFFDALVTREDARSALRCTRTQYSRNATCHNGSATSAD